MSFSAKYNPLLVDDFQYVATFQEEDGVLSDIFDTLKFPDGTMTDNLDGSASVVFPFTGENSWKGPVINIQTDPPVSPDDGDEYLVGSSSAWYVGWSFRKKFTFAAAFVKADETGFLMRLNIEGGSDEVFSKALASGDDFVVTDSDGTTKIPHYIKTYSTGSEVLEILCKVDLSNGVAKDVYVYYGNAGSGDQREVIDTFRSDYGIFYPMVEDGVEEKNDKTLNSRNITASNGTLTETAVTAGFGGGLTGSANGEWDMAWSIGSKDWAGADSNLDYWEELWRTRTHRIIVKTPASITGTRPTLFAEGGASNGIILYAFDDGGGYKIYARWWSISQGWAGDHQVTDATISNSTVYVIDMTFDFDGTDLYALYVNGVEQDTPADPGDYMNAHSGTGAIFETGSNSKNYHDGTFTGNNTDWTIFYLASMNNFMTEAQHQNFYNNWGDYANSMTVGAEEEPAGATGAWAGQEDDRTKYVIDTWIFTTSLSGDACYVQNYYGVGDGAYLSYDGADWGLLQSAISHNSLQDLQGGQADPAEYYHQTLYWNTRASQFVSSSVDGLMTSAMYDQLQTAFGSIIDQFLTDSGTATSADNEIQILGGSALDTSGATNVVTINVTTDGINDTHIDWGTGANQVSAVDLPIADSVGNLAATDVEGALAELFSGPTNFLTTPSANPTLDYHVANKQYVDNAIGFTFDYFFNDTASGIGGIYYNMTDTDLGGAESTLSTAGLGAGDDQALVNFATLSGEPGIEQLNAGIYDVHTHVEKTAGTRSLNIYAALYKYETDTTETLLATSEVSNEITSKIGVDLHIIVSSDITITATDRLIIKLFANVGSSGSNVTVAIYQEGDLESHFSFSTTSNILSNIFLRQDGGTGTGTFDFGGADDFEIPNSATPTVDTDGQIAIDTTVADFSHGVMIYYGGEVMGVIAMPIAQFTSPSDNDIISYNATNDEFELVALSTTDEKVGVDSVATAGYLGAAFNDGVLRTDGTVITYTDGGDFVTIALDQTQIDHTSIANIGTNSHADIDTHIASTANPHSVDMDDTYSTGKTITIDAGAILFDVNNGTAEDGNFSIFNFDVDIPSGAGAVTLDTKFNYTEDIAFVNLDAYRATTHSYVIDYDFSVITGVGESGTIIKTLFDIDITATAAGVSSDGATVVLTIFDVDVPASDLKLAVTGNIIDFKSGGVPKFTVDVVGNTTIEGTLDVTGAVVLSSTVNIDGALDIDAATQMDGTLTVGVNDTGHDVTFFGASDTKKWEWIEANDKMIVAGDSDLIGAVTVTTAKTTLAATAAGFASLNLPAGTVPDTPVEGDMWNDSTDQAVAMFASGATQNIVGVLYTNTSDSAEIQGTSSETDFTNSSYTLPADFFTPGKAIRVTVFGIHDTGGIAPNLNLKIYLGGSFIMQTESVRVGSTSEDRGWWMMGTMICRTTGGSGTVMGQGQATISTSNVGGIYCDMENGDESSGTGAKTVDTTGTLEIKVTAQWSNADANNEIVMKTIMIEALN